jgi:hypothetical protein
MTTLYSFEAVCVSCNLRKLATGLEARRTLHVSTWHPALESMGQDQSPCDRTRVHGTGPESRDRTRVQGPGRWDLDILVAYREAAPYLIGLVTRPISSR